MGNKRILVAVPTFGPVDPRHVVTAFMIAKFPGTELMQVRRSMPDKARNGLVDQLLKMKQDYILFLDDDMVVEGAHPAALVEALLKEMEKDPSIGIIAPRAYKRTTPFFPCVFKKAGEAKYKPMADSGKGLVEVDAIHCAATMIRPSVFGKVKRPWFEFLKIGDVELGEDISFTRKAKEAGVKIVCHTDIEIQHISDPVLIGEEAFKAYNAIAGPDEKVAEDPPKPQIVRP